MSAGRFASHSEKYTNLLLRDRNFELNFYTFITLDWEPVAKMARIEHMHPARRFRCSVNLIPRGCPVAVYRGGQTALEKSNEIMNYIG